MSLRGFLACTLAAGLWLPAGPAAADRDKKDDKRDHRRDDDDDDRAFREWRGPHQAIAVTGFAPRGGPPGTVVTISGTGFMKLTRVTIGGRRVRHERWDSGSLSFRIPDDIGDGQIVLRNPGPFNDLLVGRLGGRHDDDDDDDHGRRLAITGFAPDAGPPGTRVSIEGRFRRGDVFSMNGRGLQVIDVDRGRVTVVIPPGARDDVFVVSRPQSGQQAVSPGRFRVRAAAPYVSSMQPGGGPPGTRVRLEGGGFFPDDVVTYGRIAARIVSRSGTHFDVVVPPQAQHSSNFTVRGPRGEASSPQPFQLDLARAGIDSFHPPAGGPGTRVELRGGRFLPGDDVLLGNLQLPVYELREGEITVGIPDGARSAPFSLRRRGQLIASSRGVFQVVYLAPPVIRGFSPNGGPPGTTVTLDGDNFTPDSRVSFEGQALPIVERQGDRRLVVVVPHNARRSGPFLVANRAGETRSGSHFQLFMPALVDSVSPTSGGWGTVLTIHGRHFRGDEVFHLADRPLDRVERRGDSWLVRVPRGAQSGVISFDSGGQRVRTPFRFDLVQLPVVESFAPRSGPPGTQVVLRGQFLGNVSAVYYGSLPCAIVRRGRELVIEIPRGARGQDYLHVDGPGGRTRTDEPFRVAMPPPPPPPPPPEPAHHEHAHEHPHGDGGHHHHPHVHPHRNGDTHHHPF